MELVIQNGLPRTFIVWVFTLNAEIIIERSSDNYFIILMQFKNNANFTQLLSNSCSVAGFDCKVLLLEIPEGVLGYDVET